MSNLGFGASYFGVQYSLFVIFLFQMGMFNSNMYFRYSSISEISCSISVRLVMFLLYIALRTRSTIAGWTKPDMNNWLALFLLTMPRKSSGDQNVFINDSSMKLSVRPSNEQGMLKNVRSLDVDPTNCGP